MRNIPSDNPEEYLCGSLCDLQSETEYPTTISSLPATAQAGLNPSQRRRVLAGNDPLLADLTLALDLLDDAILVLHESGRIIHFNQVASVLAVKVPTDGFGDVVIAQTIAGRAASDARRATRSRAQV